MIKFLDLQRVTALYADEYHEAIGRVVDSGWYLLGKEVAEFEHDYAAYIGTRHCIGVGNGLDALTLIYRAYIEMGLMQPGDEVIVPANTYIASILAITENGLKPVLVEPRFETLEIDDNLIENHITPRTRSIMIVHLYGRCAYTERINDICQRHHLLLVEDNAQAHGCCFSSPMGTPKRTGSLGHAAGHSFYPAKNMGAFGDAGAVTTDDDALADMIRSLGNYGSSRKYVFDYCGRNSRMDELQAAVLKVKLRHIDEDNLHRQAIAHRYIEALQHIEGITLPLELTDEQNVWHLFPIFSPERDLLQQHLGEQGVQTMIHYPIPPHRQQCFASWNDLSLPITERIHNEELSLPISQAMTIDEADRVVEALGKWRE
ncbi:MAG: DegT/DnrJ/EryC1/StrS family aminotransferase [Prevotella sp.]|nr:DegT/DnrJ/EryC1/StrS family aminotransferase [Prevotella sp.]